MSRFSGNRCFSFPRAWMGTERTGTAPVEKCRCTGSAPGKTRVDPGSGGELSPAGGADYIRATVLRLQETWEVRLLACSLNVPTLPLSIKTLLIRTWPRCSPLLFVLKQWMSWNAWGINTGPISWAELLENNVSVSTPSFLCHIRLFKYFLGKEVHFQGKCINFLVV